MSLGAHIEFAWHKQWWNLGQNIFHTLVFPLSNNSQMVCYRICQDNHMQVIKTVQKGNTEWGMSALFQTNPRDDQLSCLSGLLLWGNLYHTCCLPVLVNPAFWLDCGCLQIVDSGRLVVSTKCGHVFCSQCLRDALTSSHTCPTCRKRLTHRQYHPLYIWRLTGKCALLFCFSLFTIWLLND